MKRQKKFSKLKLPSLSAGIKDVIAKRAAGVIVLAVLLASVIILTNAFIYRSNYFRLRYIDIVDSYLDNRSNHLLSNQLLNMYGGRNIFKINLNRIAGSLQAVYPDAKEVVARAKFPDRITIKMKFRKPVAVVHHDRLYPIDADGFVLPNVNPGTLRGLPTIEGVNIKYNERAGRKASSRNLKIALELLKELKKHDLISDYGVSVIDAGDPKNVSFYLASGLEARIGGENFAARIETLAATLKDPRLVVNKIKYVDLRFNDVIIGPK